MPAEIHPASSNHLPSAKNLLISLFSILLFLYLSIAKVAPQGLNPAILQQFSGINFGLASAYALAYFFGIIFAGFFADHYGYRKALAVALIAALISTYVAATATQLSVFTGALALLGFANGVGLIGALKAGATVLPRHYFGFFAAVLFASLLIIYHLGLHQIIFKLLLGTAHLGLILSLVGIICLLVVFTLAPTPLPQQDATMSPAPCTTIMGNYKIWLVAAIFLLSQFFVNNFSLYGQVFLTENSQLSSEQINNVLININHALIVGTLIAGALCSLIARKHLLLAGGYLLAALCFLFFTYLPHLNHFAVFTLLYLTAFFLGANVICYALAYDHCPSATKTSKVFSFIAVMGVLGNALLTLLPVEVVMNDSHKLASYKTQSINLTTLAPFHVDKLFLTLIALSLVIGALLALGLNKNTQR